MLVISFLFVMRFVNASLELKEQQSSTRVDRCHNFIEGEEMSVNKFGMKFPLGHSFIFPSRELTGLPVAVKSLGSNTGRYD